MTRADGLPTRHDAGFTTRDAAFTTCSGAGFTARPDAGFTMIGLMVAVVVINIALAVVVTSWVTLDRRAREAELLWRGRQYVRALRCHQQETGSLPTELEELLESDCIRRLWPDPMTDQGEWEPIRLGDVAPERETSLPGQGQDDLPGLPGQSGPGGQQVEQDRPGVPGQQATADDPATRALEQLELLRRIERLRLEGAVQEAGELSRLVEEARALDADRQAALLSQLARAQGGEVQQEGDAERGPASAQDMLDALRQQRERLLGPLRDSESRSRADSRSIVGVVSRSGTEGLRTYHGSRLYSDWRFLVQGEGFR